MATKAERQLESERYDEVFPPPPRGAPRREFMAWYARKYGERFCERNHDHLTGSYAHEIECCRGD